MSFKVKVAIVDNAVDHHLYTPVEHWAAHLAVPWEAFRARDGRLPSPGDGFSHVILTGSEASILDREPWVYRVVSFIQEAAEKGLAILGSCYGHQLLALSLNGPASVRRCPQPEIGWIPVDVLETSDFLGESGTAYSFSLHFDEVVDTRGQYKILASTAVCPVQAMSCVGRRAWGLQIHPEIDIPTGQRFLRDSIGLNARTTPLYEAALKTEPRDSGLIHRIVKYFLNS
jgi:GMP synthase-like glutamine amidotransferase